MTRTTLILAGLLLIFGGIVYSIPYWMSYFTYPIMVPDPLSITISAPGIYFIKLPLLQAILIIVGLLVLIEGRISGN